MSYPWLESLQQQLYRQADQQKLHHALLISGITGLGKVTLAQQLAQQLLCQQPSQAGPCGHCHACALFLAGNHPDFHPIKTDNRVITVDSVRQLNAKLAERSQQGGAKVALFYDAQSFNESSANALLKSLEEPGDNTFFILICESVGRLMPTITSRCQKLLLKPPADCRPWLAGQGYNNVSSGLLHLYQGAPLAILTVLQQGKADEHEQIADAMQQLLDDPCYSFQFADFIAKDLTTRMRWFSYLLHDIQKVALGVGVEQLVFAHHLTLLQRCAALLPTTQLYHLANRWSTLTNEFSVHTGLRKELLLSQYFIDLKNQFGGKGAS
ncbi:DNA polymerase III subunit delta' [Motilimonas sp. KMU-193]|uniref:DNA polymerase III subunit delta' n=1 Tax=Motilimonas sp. KMU-193 TaxID=3388668 RepID=UPI00396B0E1A